MRAFGSHLAAFQKSLQLIFETDLVVRNRPGPQCIKREMDSYSREPSRQSGHAVRAMRQVTAKELVRSLATQTDRYSALAQLGKEPDGESPCIRRRFIRVIGKLLDHLPEVRLRIQVQLFVLGLITLCDLADVGGFVEASSLK